MAVQPVTVYVVIDRTPNEISCSKECTAEELCIILCKKYNIPPLTRTLFALRIKGTDHFLKDNRRVLDSTRKYELRIRFKVPRLSHLITLDEITYDYYFQQARNDVNENKIPEIKYPDHKKELLGLGIVDMTRAVLEEKLSAKDVVNNYKKYVPKVIFKRHGPFVKKYAHDYLPKLCSVGHTINKLKSLYLQELYAWAPNYLAEEYDNVLWKHGSEVIPVRLVVAPFHPEKPGIRLFNTREREWIHVCTIDELIYLTRNGEYSLEVSRRGSPLFFKFKDEEQLSAFISVCDGCYRLMVKWTFNLSKDDETPSLKELQRIKCHGPVGGAFSYRKLDEKRAKTHGCYILRQCQDDYNVYYLDVCTRNRTTETYRMEYQGHCWMFNNVEYCSIEGLIRAHQKPDERIFLNECIPPSEYDKSQLLLCGEPQKTGVRVAQAELQEILKDNKSPRCLPNKDILLYTGLPCLPWKDESVSQQLEEIKAKHTDVNYCRTVYDSDVTPWCYVRRQHEIVKNNCSIRLCQPAVCKMAGTANDYMGTLNVTRSNRKCKRWASANKKLTKMWLHSGIRRDMMYPEGNIANANNFCRNPTRSLGGSEKTGTGNITTTYKALWKLDETKKLLVAFKTLQREKVNDHLKDFIELASKWACVQSSCIVRLYGITLCSPTALVLEYLPCGPFDKYLKDNANKMNDIHFLKVAASLAGALWDLSEAGVVHGDIRCRRLLLAAHDADRIVVKLSGPSIRRYTANDVHWIPVDFFGDMSMARRSVSGDIWAYATTLWEIFSCGASPALLNPVLTTKSYEKGDRLPKPARCPRNVWTLMTECWSSEPMRPQAIMRDINHLLHMDYVPTPAYETIHLPSIDKMDYTGTVTSDKLSELSDAHSLISVDSSEQSMNSTVMTDYDADNKSASSFEIRTPSLLPRSMSSLAEPFGMDNNVDSFEPSLMESIISQGKTYLVTRINTIGVGNYGQVFKGWMESDSDKSNGRLVAVKKLNSNGAHKDFKNELEIMRSLHHDHIVEILGFSETGPDVLIVMEYLEEGSLFQYLRYNGSNLRMSHLLKYALDIASGMDHISAKNIVHRDLATRNILVVNKKNVKISDFGLARIIPKEENEYRIQTERFLPFNWYAPESAVKPFNFSSKSDVWSYGVTMWEIFSLAQVEVPKFDTSMPTERASAFGIPKDCPTDIYRHLMKDCWELEPKRRPRFIDLVHTCKRLIEEYKHK